VCGGSELLLSLEIRVRQACATIVGDSAQRQTTIRTTNAAVNSISQIWATFVH